MLDHLFSRFLEKWVSKLVSQVKAEYAAGRCSHAIALCVIYTVVVAMLCVLLAHISRASLYAMMIVVISKIIESSLEMSFEEIMQRLTDSLVRILRNFQASIKQKKVTKIKKPNKPVFLFNWAAKQLPEEYYRHLLDCRKQWLEEGCSPWVIRFKTAGFLLATYWAIFIIWLQNLVSRNRAV